jgi:hypothetical protein
MPANRPAALTALAAVALLAACAGDAPNAPASPSRSVAGTPAVVQQDLAVARQATARFHNVEVALAEGYVPTPECAAIPGVGGMGVHYINPALMGLTIQDGRVHGLDAQIDVTKPEMLVYEPQADGSLRLVAVEYYASRDAWGGGAPPALFGQPFDYNEDDPSTPVDEAHGFTTHYDLHVWLWRNNPAGMFAPWNSAVTCPAGAPHADAAHAGH